MPQWGLTSELRSTEPWGIDEWWLKPGKVITDPIHGDVYLNRLEQAIVDSRPFQRLRRIRQLGTTHLVYPGATHTRFSHALGALRTVQDLFDIVLGQRDGRHGSEDLFAQWERERPDWRNDVARSMVVARLGALLHDVCHVAYGHSVEDDLGLLTPHDKNPERFERFWGELGAEHRKAEEVNEILNQEELKAELRPLILSKEPDPDDPCEEPRKPEDVLRYPFVADMVGNTICADLIDYLDRDHLYTGLPEALGRRFMTAFYVTPDNVQGRPESGQDEARMPPGPVHYAQRMALHIHRNGRERPDIVSELLKYLRFRYELQERVIVHHAKLAADAMIGKMLSLWRESRWVQLARRRGLANTRHAIDEGFDIDEIRVRYERDRGWDACVTLDEEVAQEIEREFCRVSDDGLLERLRDQGTRRGDSRMRSAAKLADAVLDRRLFKRCGHAAPAEHDQLFKLYGSERERRRLERDAANYAGIADDKVAIWLPEPKMRLKLAEVLVDYGSGIAPFNEYSPRGNEIYQAHRDLWRITVYVHESVLEEEGGIVLARLAETMGVAWEELKDLLGPDPASWPHRLAARRVARATDVDDFIREVLLEAEQQAFRSGDTFTGTVRELQPLAAKVRRKQRAARASQRARRR